MTITQGQSEGIADSDSAQAAAPPNLRAAARELDDAGLNVIPIKQDGSKMPDLPRWKKWHFHWV